MRSKGLAVLLLGLAGVSVHGCAEKHGTPGFGLSGAAGASGLAGTTGAAGTEGVDAGISGAAGFGPVGGAMVEPTPGCGREATQQPGLLSIDTIQTMGTKSPTCADKKCGAWSYARQYYVRLPTGYDNQKPYPLVLEGPGCGGRGNNLYNNPVLDASVVRVGLSPSIEAAALHSTNPGQGCFDDRDGDDSVDFAFYEALYDKLAVQLCFDRNRVFAAGNSSGARLANELGCKYAGDRYRPVRGVMTHGAGLPVIPTQVPTCTSHPMAGMWVHQVSNQTTPFTETTLALARAMDVNGCTIGTSYETAEFEPFPLSGDPNSCKRVKGCPDTSPLVICPLTFFSQSSDDEIVNPGWAAFLKLFEAAP